MESTLYTICYISKSNINDDIDNIKNEIANILAVANNRNTEHQVTGALLYSGGFFLQILEGKIDEVEYIYELIQQDSRHYDINIIFNHSIEKRRFPEWSMALAGIELNRVPELNQLLDASDNIKVNNFGQETFDMVVKLLLHYQQHG